MSLLLPLDFFAAFLCLAGMVLLLPLLMLLMLFLLLLFLLLGGAVPIDNVD